MDLKIYIYLFKFYLFKFLFIDIYRNIIDFKE